MDKNIDKLAEIIEQLHAMGSPFDDSTAIGIQVTSIDLPKLHPATATTKTLTDKDVHCEDVNASLIDEARNIKSGSLNRSSIDTKCCIICKIPNHNADKCFLNPFNSNNKSELKSNPNISKSNNRVDNENRNGTENDLKKKSMQNKKHCAMVLTGDESTQIVD